MKHLVHKVKIGWSVAVLFLMVSCSDDDTIAQYRLQTQVSPPESGSISPTSGMYNEGMELSLGAVPAAEYVFKNWSGDAAGNENPMLVSMTSDKNITAVFEKKNYAVTIHVIGEGTVTEEVIVAKTTTDYPSGTQVRITAIPNTGYVFTGWSGDHTGSENPIQLMVDQALDLTATFAKQNYEMSLEIVGEGTITEEVLAAKFATNYPFGMVVRITAIPEKDWQFVGWSGDLSGTENPAEITINSPLSITATFEEMTFEKTYVPDDNFEQALIALGYDTVLNDYVRTSNISGVTSIELINKGISDLTGIEAFVRLEYLDCSLNQLQQLDFASNKALRTLQVQSNQLTKLNIATITELQFLRATENLLTCIQVNESQLEATGIIGPGALFWWIDEGVEYSLDCN